MRRLVGACASAILASAIAVSIPTDAAAGRNCPYLVVVQRREARELSGRACDVEEVVDWLRAVPGAGLSSQTPPPGEIRDGFTVSIFLVRPSQPQNHAPLVSERVYPFADAGLVGFVPARTVFRYVDPPRTRWVVRVGWRTLDAIERLPPVLRRLGITLPVARPAASSTGEAPPTVTPAAQGPDLVTLLFLLLAVVGVAAITRRKAGRSDQHARAGAE